MTIRKSCDIIKQCYGNIVTERRDILRKQTEGVTDIILAAAEKEFLGYGYTNASLRRISAESGVSTHSIYTRFGDKAGLFDALVKTPADELFTLYRKAIDLDDNITMEAAQARGDIGTDIVIGFIYEHFNAFRLIFCCSAGTAYSDYLERLAQLEENAYLKLIRNIRGGLSEEDEFFIHVICASALREMYEMVAHELSFEQAKSFMEREKIYRFAGWNAFVENKIF